MKKKKLVEKVKATPQSAPSKEDPESQPLNVGVERIPTEGASKCVCHNPCM